MFINSALTDECWFQVFGNESINVEYVDYFRNFNSLLETTPKR